MEKGWGLRPRSTNQLEEIFPKVLSHESEESEKGPAKRIVAGVAIVWVLPGL